MMNERTNKRERGERERERERECVCVTARETERERSEIYLICNNIEFPKSLASKLASQSLSG